jgi:hypothetical protein
MYVIYDLFLDKRHGFQQSWQFYQIPDEYGLNTNGIRVIGRWNYGNIIAGIVEKADVKTLYVQVHSYDFMDKAVRKFVEWPPAPRVHEIQYAE